MALKFNVEKARAAGLSDEEIRRRMQAGPPQRLQQTQPQTQTQPQQQEDEGGGLIDWLPTIGAVGGSFVPGLGTIAGGVAGAGLGALAKELFDEEEGVDPLSIGTEAGLAGVGGAVGSKVLSPLLKSIGGGATRLSTIAPKSTVGKFSQQQALTDLAAKTPKLRGSAFNKFKNVEDVIDNKVNQVDDLLGDASETIPGNTFRNTVQQLGEGMDPNDARNFQRVYNRAVKKVFGEEVPESLNAKQMNQLRRELNKQAGAAFRQAEKGSVLSAPNQALLNLRDVTDDFITQLAPAETRSAVSGLNKEISTLIKGIPEFKTASEEGLVLLGTRVPLLSQALPRAFQAGADVTGRGALRAAPQGGRAGAIAGTLFGGDQLTGDQEEVEGEVMQEQPGARGEEIYSGMLGQQQDGQGGDALAGMMGGSGQNPRELLRNLALLDLFQNEGENISKINTLLGLFPEEELSESEQKQQSLSQSLDLLQGNLQSAGGAQGAGGVLQSILGRTPGVRSLGIAEEAQVFEDQRRSLIAPLARAISGEVGVLTDKDIARAEGLLPRLSDPPAVAQKKIQDLKVLLQQAGTAGTPDSGILQTGNVLQ